MLRHVLVRQRTGSAARSAHRARRKHESLVGVEGVADAAHGANDIGATAGVQGLAQTKDVNVDRSGLDVDVAPPYGVEKPLARKHAARVLHQDLEQAELGRSQPDRAPFARDPVRGQVHDDVAVAQTLVGVGGTGAAQDRADPRVQLLWREGFGHVVVGARVQSANPIGFLSARRQHDHGKPARVLLLADLTADLDARELGQHPVENHEIGWFLLHQQQRLLSVVRDGGTVSLALEVVADHLDQRLLVLDQKDQGFRHVVSPFAAGSCWASTRVELAASRFGRSSSGLAP